MIRSSSRKVKPTSKFEEFKLTSNGKKRGRPRKSLDGADHNDTDPHFGQNHMDLSTTPDEQPQMSKSFSHLPAKQEPEQLSPQQTHQQPHQPQQQFQQAQQHQLDASIQPPHQPPPKPVQHHQGPGRPRREPKTPVAIHFGSETREDGGQQAEKSQQYHGHATSTPIREPKSALRPISSRKEELMRLRDENMTAKSELEQLRVEYEELKRQTSYTGLTVPKIDFDDLKERYQRDVTYAKRHEWCVVCLTQSRYYCCWNTTYCSQKCQVTDWYARHGKSCERRRSYLKSAT